MPEVTKHSTTSCFSRARAEPKCLNHGSHNVSHTLLSPSSSLHTSCPHTTALPAFVREEPAPHLASLSVPLMQVCSATKPADPDRGSSDRQSSCFSSLPWLLGGLTIDSWVRKIKSLKGRNRAWFLYPQGHLPHPCRSPPSCGRTESAAMTGLVKGIPHEGHHQLSESTLVHSKILEGRKWFLGQMVGCADRVTQRQ